MVNQSMVSGEFAIQIENVGKCYQLYDNPANRLKQFILPRIRNYLRLTPRQYFREFWALRGVSFNVRRGEAVGIVGRNGAGKSTLLQLISGILTPTQGNIKVNGSVAALLELGSGFNMEFTGRENVYMTASVLGLATAKIDRKFDEIAAFADIGDFIDQPLSTYSSGMVMRLAFAVNTCVDPDILIVDEALGVGDAPFQAKCYKRLRNLVEQGSTVLFVSHDVGIVRSVCSRAIWLKDGSVEEAGDAQVVAKSYERYCWIQQGVVFSGGASEPVGVEQSVGPVRPTGERSETDGTDVFTVGRFPSNPNMERSGTGDVRIKNLLLYNEAGELAETFDYNEEITFRYLIELSKSVDSDFVLGIRLKDLTGNFVVSMSDAETIHRLSGNRGDRYDMSVRARLNLSSGKYSLLTGIFGFHDGGAVSSGRYDFTDSVIWDLCDDALIIGVRENKLMPLAGPVHQSVPIELIKYAERREGST